MAIRTCQQCGYHGARLFYRCQGSASNICGRVICGKCFKGYKCKLCPHGNLKHYN